MESVSHRDLRNNSGKVLERVRNGETVAVTNHGEVTAILVPPHFEAFAVLIASGRVREATDPSPFGPAARVARAEPTAVVLNDLRGDR